MSGAYAVPAGEVPAQPPVFSTSVLEDEQGRLVWVPHVVLGVRLEDVGRPAFLGAISDGLRQLQKRVHPDRCSGDANLSM